MKGYKATDKDLKCRGFQFEIGKWYEHEGDLKLCEKGFHFCEQPSGPWSYYSDPGTRIFEVEAEEVLDAVFEPGTEFKRVCRKIRLVKEVAIGGDKNTGDRNTGDCNTGYYNTGDYNTGNCNTGDCNTGYYNTGDYNTGDYNTGDYNTGDYNTGDCNTGYYNTGDYNTGNCNTGYYNTGYYNTGNCNTGNCNTTNYSSGFFCAKEPKVISFDLQTKLTRAQFMDKYPEWYSLGEALQGTEEIDLEPYKKIPGITKAKLKKLHETMIAARKKV